MWESVTPSWAEAGPAIFNCRSSWCSKMKRPVEGNPEAGRLVPFRFEVDLANSHLVSAGWTRRKTTLQSFERFPGPCRVSVEVFTPCYLKSLPRYPSPGRRRHGIECYVGHHRSP